MRDLAAADNSISPAPVSGAPHDGFHDAHFAVVVGINRYPGFTDLHGPLDDAADFVDWLVSPSGGALPKANVVTVPAPRERIELAVDQARPNVFDVLDALRTVNTAIEQLTAADAGAWQRSRLYFFVAGHGMVPEGSDSGALFTANASRDELGHNINLLLYKIWYQHYAGFRELVVFADCCRSLMPDAPSFGPPFSRRIARGRTVRWAMGYGTQFGALAAEGPPGESARGYFTSALLRSLRRAGSKQHPLLRWGDLKGMIHGTLRELTSPAGQRADCVGDDDLEFGPPLPITVRPDELSRLTIHFTGEPDLTVDLLDGRLKVIGSWSGADGAWQLAVPAGLYLLARHDSGIELRTFAVIGNADVHL